MRSVARLKMGYYPLPAGEGEASISPVLSSTCFRGRSLRGSRDRASTRHQRSSNPSLWSRTRRGSSADRELTGHRDHSEQCLRCRREIRVLLPALPESALRLGDRVGRQQSHGAAIPRPHLPLAGARRRSGVGHSFRTPLRLRWRSGLHFGRLSVLRMTDEESVRFRQIAVLGVRRTFEAPHSKTISGCCKASIPMAVSMHCQS